MRLPFAQPVLNEDLATPDRPVWRIEVLPISAGQVVRVEFIEASGEWRQGVWLATEGSLECNGSAASQLVLWEDTSPRVVDVTVHETDGRLRLYNIWDSGRGFGDHESQSATAGMVKRVRDDGAFVYACNDIGVDPDFTKLTFAITVL